MSEMETYTKKGRRELSPFMAQEMLYDYVCGKLDFERKLALEQYLELNRDSALEVQRIKKGMEYLGALGSSEIDAGFIQKIAVPTSFVQLMFQKTRFHEWPSGFRWALEALFIAGGVTLIAIMIPWHKLTSLRWSRSSEIILTEISKTYEEQPESPVATGDESVTYPDDSSASGTAVLVKTDSKPPEVSPTTITAVLNSPSGEKAILSETVAPPAASPPTSAAAVAAAPTTVPAAPTPSQSATATTPSIAESAKDTSAAKSGQGFLWRGTIQVTNVQAATPKIVEKLVELGGRKAGEVDLGWKKGNGSYFHFTAPEAKIEEVKSIFTEYGKLILNREKHDRAMPEGIVRLIITVNEKEGPQN